MEVQYPFICYALAWVSIYIRYLAIAFETRRWHVHFQCHIVHTFHSWSHPRCVAVFRRRSIRHNDGPPSNVAAYLCAPERNGFILWFPKISHWTTCAHKPNPSANSWATILSTQHTFYLHGRYSAIRRYIYRALLYHEQHLVSPDLLRNWISVLGIHRPYSYSVASNDFAMLFPSLRRGLSMGMASFLDRSSSWILCLFILCTLLPYEARH